MYTLTHTLTQSHTLTLSHSHILTLTLTHSHSHTPSLTHTQFPSQVDSPSVPPHFGSLIKVHLTATQCIDCGSSTLPVGIVIDTEPVSLSPPPQRNDANNDELSRMSKVCLPMYSLSMYIHVLMRDEKEGRKKQARSNKQQGKATQHTQGIYMYM